jgi:hypothetical protein
MKYTVLILLGITLSNCAAIQVITGAPIQARDVISSINTVNNLAKYSEPAAREELEREVKAQLRRWENQ